MFWQVALLKGFANVVLHRILTASLSVLLIWCDARVAQRRSLKVETKR